MMIIGVDYHPSCQTIAFLIEETGEYGEQELNHSDGEAEKFYRELKQRGISVRVGMEVTGYSRWFERLLAELGFEVWIGDAAEIKAKRVRKKKTDHEDARLLLKLLLENRFPQIWIPSPENRDLRQLLIGSKLSTDRASFREAFRFPSGGSLPLFILGKLGAHLRGLFRKPAMVNC
jgi:transposase